MEAARRTTNGDRRVLTAAVVAAALFAAIGLGALAGVWWLWGFLRFGEQGGGVEAIGLVLLPLWSVVMVLTIAVFVRPQRTSLVALVTAGTKWTSRWPSISCWIGVASGTMTSVGCHSPRHE